MRSEGDTKFGEPSRVTAATKFRIDCFAAPSFHEGSAAAGVADCACTGTVSSGTDKTGSTAKVDSRIRRLTLEERRVDFMLVSCIGKMDAERGIVQAPGIGGRSLVRLSPAD